MRRVFLVNKYLTYLAGLLLFIDFANMSITGVSAYVSFWLGLIIKSDPMACVLVLTGGSVYAFTNVFLANIIMVVPREDREYVMKFDLTRWLFDAVAKMVSLPDVRRIEDEDIRIIK